MSRKENIAIDLFAGAGGLSLGLSEAGFKVVAGVENDRDCMATLRTNNGKMKVIQSDIQQLSSSDLLKNAGVNKSDIKLIVGGPPCQGFSVSNKRNRDMNNPINVLYREFFRIVADLRPRMFLLENVEGICTIGEGAILHDILELGKKINYFVRCISARAEYVGVPQKRKRVFFVGSSDSDPFIPEPEPNLPTTVRKAIDDLPHLENGNTVDSLEYSRNANLSNYQKMMRGNNVDRVSNNLVTRNGKLVLTRYSYIPQGGNWQNIPKSLMSNYKNLSNCHRWIYYRLKWDEPSIVISNYRKNMLIHPEQNRGLSVREAARIQSFPDQYLFIGKLGSQQQQIANAVPPLLARWIGVHLMKLMEE
jgi:DNA (cytosine-5)-methyltransferase 1